VAEGMEAAPSGEPQAPVASTGQQVPTAVGEQQAPATPGESEAPAVDPYGIWMTTESIRGSGAGQAEVRRILTQPEAKPRSGESGEGK
jgi:hypothetical protein